MNRRIVTFDYRLRNGDIVEIITGKSGSPSRDWLNLVKTSQAKNRIRNWFRKEKREENLARGRDIYEREIRKYGEAALAYLKSEKVAEIAKKYRCAGIDNFYVGLAENYISLNHVMATIKEEAKLEPEPAQPPETNLFGRKKRFRRDGAGHRQFDGTASATVAIRCRGMRSSAISRGARASPSTAVTVAASMPISMKTA